MTHQRLTLLRISARFISLGLLAVGLVVNSTNAIGASSDELHRPMVTVAQGTLIGTREDGIDVFKGIPFAAPPVGPLRWQAPITPDSWKGTRSVSAFGPQCMQQYIYDDMRFRAPRVSEDCLYLNVWSPEVNQQDALPVLVYFYGGGFIAGDGSEPRYDGASMASRGIVTVTLNYRLGIFGLLAHQELSDASSRQGSGNYTLLDQAAALQWVKNNIAQFGGDPKRITIAGESAGAMSVSALMASHKSNGLFHGAIGQSGALLGPPLGAVTLSHAHDVNQKALLRLAEFLKLDVQRALIPQLRAVDADILLDAVHSLGIERFSITVDGDFFTDLPINIYQQGKIAKVPLLAGVNSQEGAYQWILGERPLALKSYREAIKALYPDDYDTVMELYPAKNTETIKDALQALASDRFISYSTWQWAEIMSSHAPVYYYVYDHIRPARKVSEGGQGSHNNRGAVHSAEIEYALGNLEVNPLYLWQKEDHHVSNQMQSYFEAFIKHQDPNRAPLANTENVVWPTADSKKFMKIRTTPEVLSTAIFERRAAFHRQYFQR